MRKFVLASAAVLGLAVTPALADSVVIAPEVDTWVMGQPEDSVTFDGDIAVGTVLPDTVHVVEVPSHKDYAYVVVNKKRVLVDAKTHKVIKVY